jgi:hypothetical protein
MTERSSLLLSLIITLMSWGGLLLFTRFIPPSSFLAFVFFFAILAVALSTTLTPIIYVLGRRLFAPRLYRLTARHAMRQGILLTLVIVLNLLLRALHSWNVFTCIVTLVTAAVIEIVTLARK